MFRDSTEGVKDNYFIDISNRTEYVSKFKRKDNITHHLSALLPRFTTHKDANTHKEFGGVN